MINFLFVKKCIICSKTGYDICENCLEKSLEKSVKNVENVHTLYYYKDELRETFIKYKFRGKKSYAKGLAKLFLQKLDVNLNDFDIITFVPISKIRIRERGFNQSELLCRCVCREFKIKPLSVLEAKNGKRQSTLTKDERKMNVLDKFSCKIDVSNKKILVIDDVYTTGSTINEIIKVLENANAKSVTAYVLFKT